MSVYLHIGRLVLEGIDIAAHQRPLLRAAVEEELARLLTADGVPSTLASDGTVLPASAGTIHLTEERNPVHLGQQIARAIYGGIGQ